YFINLKQSAMNSLLYIVAVILIIGWALGVFVYSATGLIHVLLVIAIISLILGLIRRPTTI
ncbi:MAG: family rane protein, partial [Chitinophagaceae bacterium]|nr:family rane protein [Chitinophagaceae bacterium]